MSYQLKSGEKLSHGIRRIARREVLGVRKSLADGEAPSESIHEARTHIKKLGALVRLVRKKLGKKSFHEFDGQLQKIGNSLSPLRDADVQLHTLQLLKKSRPLRRAGNSTNGLQTKLTKAQRSRQTQTAREHKRHQRQIKKLLTLIETWSLGGLKKKTLQQGITRTRNRLRTRLVESRQAPTVKNLHVWRKAAKDLTNQLAVLETLEPVDQKTLADLKKLGQLLGDDHDLATFGLRAGELRPSVWKPIQSVIQRKRSVLQKAAFELARKMKLSGSPVQFPCK